jgi:hypothetical protein
MNSLPTCSPRLGASNLDAPATDDDSLALSLNLFLKREALSEPDSQRGLSLNLFFPHREEREKNRSKFRFPYPRKNSDFPQQVYKYLIKTGLSDLNLCVHTYGMTVPELAELADFYLDVVYARGSRHVHSGRDSSNVKIIGGISHDHAERVARDAATFVLEQWDSDYTPRRRREARKGGETSRRGPKYPHALLTGLEGLTAKQQSAALGIPIPTISRMRARARAAAEPAPYTSIGEQDWHESLDYLPASLLENL